MRCACFILLIGAVATARPCPVGHPSKVVAVSLMAAAAAALDVDALHRHADKDGDGHLDKAEILQHLNTQQKVMYPEHDRHAQMQTDLAAMDADADGKVTVEEYLAHLEENRREAGEEVSEEESAELREAEAEDFAKIDHDGDGVISMRELKKSGGFDPGFKDEVHAIVAQADTDRDGKVSSSELKAHVSNKGISGHLSDILHHGLLGGVGKHDEEF
eukprot:g7292.t1